MALTQEQLNALREELKKNKTIPVKQEKKGILEKIGRATMSVGAGVVKGAIDTVQGLSDIGQKIQKPLNEKIVKAVTGKEYVDEKDEIPEKYRKPEGTAESVGYGLEKIAEFMIPASAVTKTQKGIQAGIQASKTGKALQATKTGRALLEGITIAGRAVPEAAVDAGVRYAQTGGDIEQAKIAGIAGGGTSAALGSVGSIYRNVVRPVVNPGVKELLTSAIKPLKSIPKDKWDEITDTSLKETIKTLAKNRISKDGVQGVNSIDDLFQLTKQSKNELWNTIKGRIAESDAVISTKPIRDNLDGVISARMVRENSSAIKKIDGLKKAYKGDMSVQEAEDILEEINQELISFYRKTGQSRYASEADPLLRADLAIAEALRKEIDRVIEKADGVGVGDLKKAYGSLSAFQTQLGGRSTVAARQNLFNIPEQIQAAEGVVRAGRALQEGKGGVAAGIELTRPVAARVLKRLDTTDNKIARAFSELDRINGLTKRRDWAYRAFGGETGTLSGSEK